jgi:hypothetical protein
MSKVLALAGPQTNHLKDIFVRGASQEGGHQMKSSLAIIENREFVVQGFLQRCRVLLGVDTQPVVESSVSTLESGGRLRLRIAHIQYFTGHCNNSVEVQGLVHAEYGETSVTETVYQPVVYADLYSLV